MSPNEVPDRILSLEKEYTFLLFPETEFGEKIADFRLRHTGESLVDALAPHITLKRRFKIKTADSAARILKILENFIPEEDISILFGETKVLGNAFSLKGTSDALKRYHLRILRELGDDAVTLQPLFEGDNFESHLTLFRLRDGMDIETLAEEAAGLFSETSMSRLALYEMVGRESAKEIYSKRLA